MNNKFFSHFKQQDCLGNCIATPSNFVSRIFLGHAKYGFCLLLFALVLFSLATGRVYAEEVLFKASMPQAVQVNQKALLQVQLSQELTKGAIPSLNIEWVKLPGKLKPKVVPGVPTSDIVFGESGIYEFTVELTLVYKNSCALATTGKSHVEHLRVEVLP